MSFLRWFRRRPPIQASTEAPDFSAIAAAGGSVVIGTMEGFHAYKAWAAAQVCAGCDVCHTGCGKAKKDTPPGEWWVTETCCWTCHWQGVSVKE